MQARTVKIFLLITALVILGFTREFFFLHLNEQARVTYHKATDSHVAESMQWLGNFTYSQLYYGKWLMTGLFTILFALLTWLIMKVVYPSIPAIRIVFIAYATLLAAAFICTLTGWMFESASEHTYTFSRFIMGIAQSPIPAAVLIPAWRLSARPSN